jgi:hypothetical protein
VVKNIRWGREYLRNCAIAHLSDTFSTSLPVSPSPEYANNPDLELKKSTYLTGRWFVYKISFAGENCQKISIHRKRKPIKKRGHFAPS